MSRLQTAIVLFLTGVATFGVRAEPVEVTVSNFVRAETDRYMARSVAQAGIGRILHVRTPFQDDPGGPEFQSFDQGKYELYVEMQLQKVPQKIEPSDRVDTALVRNFSAASGILEYADENEIDMVVIGTHGRTGLSQFLLGSVAEKVVRHANCPVLSVADHRDAYRNQP